MNEIGACGLMIKETKTKQNRQTGRFTSWIGQERILNVHNVQTTKKARENVQTTKKARANRAKVPFFIVGYATL